MRTRVVILAAGKGKRMNAEIPKVLVPIHEKPMASYVLDAVRASGIDADPVIVVGFGADQVKAALGPATYVTQAEQLGTGHAVQTAEQVIDGTADQVMVLYGDHPFTSADTVRRLADAHEASGAVLTLLTIPVSDFEDWRAPFYEFGRIVRDADGAIEKIVELKDASPEEKKITELNSAFFCFNANWLWDALRKLKNENAQKEYYLTDLVSIALQEGKKIHSTYIDPKEAIGVNTPAHLEVVRKDKESFV